MESKTPLQVAEEMLKPWTVEVRFPDEQRMDVVVDRKDIRAAAAAMLTSKWGYLTAITGLDHPAAPVAEGQTTPAEDGYVELLYHYPHRQFVTTLRVKAPYGDCVVDSICDSTPSATLFEREIIEMFGVEMKDTPNTDRLLLPDEWPAGVYPLRKSYTGTVGKQPE